MALHALSPRVASSARFVGVPRLVAIQRTIVAVDHILGLLQPQPVYRRHALMALIVFRSPKPLVSFHGGRKRVWFLLHRRQLHQGLTTLASAPLSTGVSALRGTPGKRG